MTGSGRGFTVADESVAGRRDHNEDGVLAVELDDGRTLLAVADGMGGHAAGEVASALALEALESAVRAGRSLDEACREANGKVFERASSEVGKQGMGTTLVTMITDGSEYSLANVGDSRAYLIGRAGIRQVTTDHSFVAEAMRRGQTEEEARASPWKDALTRSIGTDADVEVDTFGPFPVEEDAAVMLCSDGLFKSLSDRELRAHFRRGDDLDESVQLLVSAAYEAGSDDNISLVVAEFGRVPRSDAATAESGATLRLEPLTDEDTDRGGEVDPSDVDDPGAPGAIDEADAAPPPRAAGPTGGGGLVAVVGAGVVLAIVIVWLLLR